MCAIWLSYISSQESISRWRGVKNFTGLIFFSKNRIIEKNGNFFLGSKMDVEFNPDESKFFVKGSAGYTVEDKPSFVVLIKNEGIIDQGIIDQFFYKNTNNYLFYGAKKAVGVLVKHGATKVALVYNEHIEDFREADGIFIAKHGANNLHEVVSKERIKNVIEEYEEYMKK